MNAYTLPTFSLVTVGIVLTTPISASAFEVFQVGPEEPTPHFQSLITISEQAGAPIQAIALNFSDLVTDAGGSVTGTLSKQPSETDEIEQVFSFVLPQDQFGDFSVDVPITAISGNRAGEWELTLESGIGDEESISSLFDFKYWSVDAVTAGQQCDKFQTITDAGTAITQNYCYDPTDVQGGEDGVPLFTPILAGAGIIHTHEGELIPFQDPGSEPPGVQVGEHPENGLEAPIIFENGRGFSGSGFGRGSSVDLLVLTECDFLADDGTVAPLTPECLNEQGDFEVDGTFALVDDEGFIEGDPEDIVSGTADIPIQDVPEPSLFLGLLATVGIAAVVQPK